MQWPPIPKIPIRVYHSGKRAGGSIDEGPICALEDEGVGEALDEHRVPRLVHRSCSRPLIKGMIRTRYLVPSFLRDSYILTWSQRGVSESRASQVAPDNWHTRVYGDKVFGRDGPRRHEDPTSPTRLVTRLDFQREAQSCKWFSLSTRPRHKADRTFLDAEGNAGGQCCGEILLIGPVLIGSWTFPLTFEGLPNCTSVCTGHAQAMSMKPGLGQLRRVKD